MLARAASPVRLARMQWWEQNSACFVKLEKEPPGGASARWLVIVLALPKAMQERTEWQTAAEMLIMAATGERPVMFADIAMRTALNADKLAPAPTPRRKPAKRYTIVR